MSNPVRLQRSGRAWSLRREWIRAFIVMLTLVLAAGLLSIFSIWKLVGKFDAAVAQRDRETSIVAELHGDLVSHEEAAHRLLLGQSFDRPAFMQGQLDTEAAFDRATAIFPANNGTREILLDVRAAWQKVQTDTGLWGQQAATALPNLKMNGVFGFESDAPLNGLGRLDEPSLRAMHDSLDSAGRLEHEAVLLLSCLFTLALLATANFYRRMTRDLFSPLAAMHVGVQNLRTGDLTHRLAVARNDELGELATAFNGMADALYGTQLALTERATHDSLTGLANRAALTAHLNAAFDADGEASSVTCGSLLFVDVDDFKDVNDTLGHEAGDLALIELVARLSRCVTAGDLLSRLGGDEFAIVIAEGDDLRRGSLVAEQILAELEHPLVINGTAVTASVSIGVAERRPQTADAAELLRQADFAMYMAKGGGKSRFQVFDAKMHDAMSRGVTLKDDLAAALPNDQFRLDYQPIIDLISGKVVGVEALLRWQHPTLGLLTPDDFLPLAQETGEIERIGCWVLETAIRQVDQWRRSIEGQQALWVSVNVSAFQLTGRKSLAALEGILTTPLAQSVIPVLEVTETALVADAEGVIASLTRLRECGARIAVDDFGIGQSSLTTLASLPIDILKIDRSFVSGGIASTRSELILAGIIDIARRLDVELIAKGIEEPQQLELVQRLGCPLGQGYLVAHPVSPDAMPDLLGAGVLWHPYGDSAPAQPDATIA